MTVITLVVGVQRCMHGAKRGLEATDRFGRSFTRAWHAHPREPWRTRRMTALDWAAKLVEENGRELAESFLSAARNGDWRAAEALMNRIYGKPEVAVVAHVPPNPATAVLKSMSLDEKLELLHSLRRGEPIALPVIEAVPPTA